MPRVINCYYGSWANYRNGDGKFTASDIDPSLCTHVTYCFFGIDSTGQFKHLDEYLDENLGMIKKTIALKNINRRLKVIAAVGGWNEGSEKYSSMASDPTKRRKFISSALQFIRTHGFDGLDIDWEYPGQRGGSPADRAYFVSLLSEVKQAFAPYHLELNVAVGASASTAALSYDIPKISKYVDYINVMAYDLQVPGQLSFNAPLRGQGQNNAEAAIRYWLANGAPASKLVLGLAFYGHTFRYNGRPLPGSPSTGEGPPGPWTSQAGFMGYNEICNAIGSYHTEFDNDCKAPYCYNGSVWIGYDNPKSIAMKTQLANLQSLAGIMIWSIDTDDFRGMSGPKFPMLRAAYQTLN